MRDLGLETSAGLGGTSRGVVELQVLLCRDWRLFAELGELDRDKVLYILTGSCSTTDFGALHLLCRIRERISNMV